MPFKKVAPNKYKSPSGRDYNSAQVKLYHSMGGHFPGQKSDKPTKGDKPDKFGKRKNR